MLLTALSMHSRSFISPGDWIDVIHSLSFLARHSTTQGTHARNSLSSNDQISSQIRIEDPLEHTYAGLTATTVKWRGVLLACSTLPNPASRSMPGTSSEMYSMSQGSVLLKAAYANGLLKILWKPSDAGSISYISAKDASMSHAETCKRACSAGLRDAIDAALTT